MPPPPPLPNEQRPYFLGRSYLSASSPAASHGPSVGSFDSSNALGAILDARHRGSSNGFVRGGGGGGGGRVGSGIAPHHHGSNSSGRRPDQDLSPQGDNTGDAGAGAASSAMHARQQYGKAFSDHQGMRFLPPPSGSGGGGGGGGLRLSSEELYGNSEAAAAAAARWRGGIDADDNINAAGGGGSADRSDPGVSRWR
ncbi:unnamed protein product, partial [Ectocarpus sp. 12 AP-2014]